MKILIDADACPVVDLTIDIAKSFQKEVFIFCDNAHEIYRDFSKTFIITQGADAVDFALLSEVKENDIVVTQDFGLASMVLTKNAHAINQNGLIYNKFNIESLLFSRHMSQKLRNSGKRTKGPKKRTKDDDLNFEQNFTDLLKKINKK
ncbi:YaiI/YqxD family protein [uncultured Cetobacterium sp.]|uniref:YaiI/YqxD family protein n=1 Tax=uncultured Cetobacterium sp. TaxID=527638 RepID=UPI002604D9B9|nr:YaiI/YqxD family protein [uncultured Cetobacterium sp.]